MYPLGWKMRSFRMRSRDTRLAVMFATPPDEIWVPTPQELLAGRVINRVNR